MATIQPIKIKICYWLLFTLLVGLGRPNMLQAETGTVINLEQAIAMALDHDYQVKSTRNDLEKAKLAVKETLINALPKIQLGAEQGENLTSGNDLGNASLTVTETIPAGFQLYGRKTVSEWEVSKWGQQTSEAEYRINQANLIYNTVSKYLNTVKAKRLLDYQVAVVANSEVKAEFAKTQLGLGKITKVAQLTAENDLAKARYELENNHQGYLVNLKQLARQIGVKDYRGLRLDQTAVSRQVIAVTDYETLQATALAKRMELQKTRLAVKEAEQELAETFNVGLPVLSLTYQNRSREESYNLDYDFLNADFSWSAAWQQDYLNDITYGDDDDLFGASKSQYKLKLSWQFGLGDNKNRIKQATYTLENAKLAQLQTAETIVAEVDQGLSAYELAVLKRLQAEQGITLYQTDLELAKLKFQLGTATTFQVKDAELKLLSAQVETENADSDLRIAATKLKLNLGELYDYPLDEISDSVH